jgi:hypothetical protein
VLDAILEGHRARTEPRIRNFGLPGFAKWADQVGSAKDPKGWSRALAGDIDLVRALRWAHGAIGGSAPDGAGGAGRATFATFLDEAAAIAGRPALRAVADRYRDLATAWVELGDALLPDAVPSLGRLKAIERERSVAFGRTGGPDLERFLQLTGEIEADERRQMRALLANPDAATAVPATSAVPPAARPDLFADLASRIRDIHAAEVAATNELARAAG